MKWKTVLFMMTLSPLLAAWQSAGLTKWNFPTEKYILDAEKEGLVKTKVQSKGGHSGDCMMLELTNLSSRSQQILIPAGTVFIAVDESEQNILMTQDLICQLSGGGKKSVNISGFCCEMSDYSPKKGSGFKVSKHTDLQVQQLVEFMKDKNYDNSISQAAVWCVANDASIADVYCDDAVKTKALREKICEITGKKDFWYSTPRNYSVDENRNIVSEPTKITGKMTTTVEKPTKVVNEVYNGANELLWTTKEIQFPRKGKYDYDFYLQITGWEKGNYYILVKGDGKELMRQDFSL